MPDPILSQALTWKVLLSGLFLGSIPLLISYHFIKYFFDRENYHIYFSFYGVSSLLYHFSNQNFAYNLETTKFLCSPKNLAIYLSLGLFFALLFTESFFSLRRIFTKKEFLPVKVMLPILFCFGPISLVLDVQITKKLSMILSFLSLSAILYFGFISFKLGLKFARFFLVSWCIAIISFFILYLELESLSSVFFLSLQSLAILFLSFSTWDREKVLFEDKFKIQKVKLKDYKKFDLELKKRSEFEEENRNLVKRNINAAKSLIETQERFKKTQDELNQAQKELIQAQKLSSLGAMISGISHEINNPVNYIGTTSYILKNELSKLNEYLNSMIEDQSDAALEFKRELESKFFLLNKSIQNIESGVQKVSEINTALRNYSRLDEFPTRDILIEELFEEALTILGAQIKFFKINKNYLNGAKAFCRRSHISQVICNLIINANDALLEKKELLEDPEFQGEITLSCKYLKDPDKDWVVFEIEDNGQGISDFAKDNIFQAFFTTKEVGKGTGLGLTICHKIIKDHDGKIEIDSSPSLGGARFKIYLPIPALENLDLEDI